MITINTEKLKELKPCTERFKNWLENYGEFSGTFAEFLDLLKISYDDKIWVSKKILTRDILERWAILCAESVLHIFESKFPNDKRPRECIEYLKSGERDRETILRYMSDCLSTYAAYDVTAAATDTAAINAAYAAAYADAYVADDATIADDAAIAADDAAIAAADAAYAAYAAYTAVAAKAAYAAADAAIAAVDADDAACTARQKQQSKNLEFLKSLLNKE